ncbi:hypothetical protein Tco_1273749 [Tanacetum coccineum]
MAAPGPSNQLARRAIDELMEFSGETHVTKYMKFFIEQQIAETMHFINVMREEAHSSTNRLAQDDKMVEYNTLMAINDVIGKAEEKLTTKEAHIDIMEAEINPV